MSEEVITRFDQMDISTEVLKAIEKMGFTEPSTVQAKTIPLMMSGVDIMAIAPTGHGGKPAPSAFPCWNTWT